MENLSNYFDNTFSPLSSSSKPKISTSSSVYAKGRQLRDVHLFSTFAHATALFSMRKKPKPCGGTGDARCNQTDLLPLISHCLPQPLLLPADTSSCHVKQTLCTLRLLPQQSTNLIIFILGYRWALAPTTSPGRGWQLCLDLMQSKHIHVCSAFACLSVSVSTIICN